MRAAVATFPIVFAAVGACRPAFDESVSSITGARVLAVAADPPEAAPGDELTLSALVVDEGGTIAAPRMAWGLCRSPRAATDTGALPTSCIDGAADPVVGDGAAVGIRIPADACAVFGPDSTAGTRPPDPDVTGGYFLPVRVDQPDAMVAFGAVRLACRLGDAEADVARAYAERYVDNRAPGVVVSVAARVAPGTTVDVTVSWTAADAEDFVVYDRATQALVEARESIVASFFATAGTFDAARSGRDGDDRATSTTNRWTAPDDAGVVHLWAVVRDGRGAVVWRSVEVDVQ